MTEPAGEKDKIAPEGFLRELIAAMREAGVAGPYADDPTTGKPEIPFRCDRVRLRHKDPTVTE